MSEVDDLRRQLRDNLATCRAETQRLRAEKVAAVAEAQRLRRELERPLRERYKKFVRIMLRQDRARLAATKRAAERQMIAFPATAWRDLMMCVHPDGNPAKDTKHRAYLELQRRESRLRAP